MSRRGMNVRKLEAISSGIADYASSRTIELLEYNDGLHLRLTDGLIATVDIWPSTGRYWIKETNYVHEWPGTIERGGEKGWLPGKAELEAFLDKIYFAGDLT